MKETERRNVISILLVAVTMISVAQTAFSFTFATSISPLCHKKDPPPKSPDPPKSDPPSKPPREDRTVRNVATFVPSPACNCTASVVTTTTSH